ncbi:MAG: FAD-dependent oxidoreductase [Armatimonadota bacterium]
MQKFPSLFSTGRIGNLNIKNRIIMAPMVRNYADDNGYITAKYLAHIESIAGGGVGAMILEASYISQEGKGFANELGLHTDEMIPGLKMLADIAHSYGAVIGPQIYHAGRQTASAISGMQPVAPSAIPDPTIGEVPHALSADEIHRIVKAYAEAARRAKEAGCDFIELHGAHGYLIAQFLSPFSNIREDEYGGSEENRMRFLVEVVQAVKEKVGSDFPVTIRLSGDEMVPGGITPDDNIEIAKRLQNMGIHALHISAGNYASYDLGYMIQPMAIPDAPLVHLAEKVKAAVSIPVIAVGKIRDPQEAEGIISSGKADFVALGRPLLADPDWPNKAKDGRIEDINKCIACNQGCVTRLFDQQDVWCTVNPITSREIEFAKPMPPTKLKVLVAGGGPAGMEAARIAAGRGHKVILCEKEDHLGGQLDAAAAAPYRPGWAELKSYLLHKMDKLGIDIRLNTEATADLARDEGVDVAIVAIGSSSFHPRIPGIDRANILTAREILEGHANATGRVIVAGGGCAGAQTAEYLAAKGHDVTIVEMLGAIAVDSPRAERELLLGRLQKMGVKVLTETKILSFEQGKIGVQNPQGLEDLAADTVVLCMGSIPNNSLAEKLQMVVPTVVTVGDALDPRRVTEAMAEGARAGLNFYMQEPELAA